MLTIADLELLINPTYLSFFNLTISLNLFSFKMYDFFLSQIYYFLILFNIISLNYIIFFINIKFIHNYKFEVLNCIFFIF